MYIATGITEEEHRAQDIAIRREQLIMRERELKQSAKGDFWNAFASVVTVAIPLITFLGLQAMFKVSRK